MVNVKDIEYVMLKLDGHSKSKLMQLVEQLFGRTKYPRQYCDHITLAYGPQQVSKFDMSLLDKKVQIDANTIIFDEDAVAMAIDRNDVVQYGINNKYPHITMAITSNVRPVYSNQLMKNYFEGTGVAKQIMLDDFIALDFTIVPHVYSNKYM